ncbi:hypothetical protein ACRAWD_12540 [Caulobacter segnis]
MERTPKPPRCGQLYPRRATSAPGPRELHPLLLRHQSRLVHWSPPSCAASWASTSAGGPASACGGLEGMLAGFVSSLLLGKPWLLGKWRGRRRGAET